jgi:predicted ATPase
MAISRQVRRLQGKWSAGTGWPKRLDWIEIDGIRGWDGQRFELRFPIMAVVGENGAGKSTVLQAAASVYKPEQDIPGRFASDFFPDTPWDRVHDAEIRYSVREGDQVHASAIRKPTGRWRGNPERRQRNVEYIDLSRIQPVSARTGYRTLANAAFKEESANLFEQPRLERLSAILGRTYDAAKMAITSADSVREVPVITQQGSTYSGWHQGAGETTIVELLQTDLPNHSLVLIDEIESSLHPRVQRRLIRDLADRCREQELQVILTTHSPYVLEELPDEARAHILQTTTGRREIVYGVSPEFAMNKMDDVPHFECDLYVEDSRAERMLIEIIAVRAPELINRCQLVPYGAASVGRALGQMVAGNRFPRPSCVYLDGDTAPAVGCVLLPGEDAPERVVFEALHALNWAGVNARTGRGFADVADACSRAMANTDHHDWVTQAANQLILSGDTLWQAMCAEWADKCLYVADAVRTIQPIEDILVGGLARAGSTATVTSTSGEPAMTHEPSPSPPPRAPAPAPAPPASITPGPEPASPPNESERLF